MEFNLNGSYPVVNYSETQPQAELEGVIYCKNSLDYNFTCQGKSYKRYTRDTLEMLILSEILQGSKLWSYKASINFGVYQSDYRNIGIKIILEDTYIMNYKNTSTAFKVFVSNKFENLKSYNGYNYPKISNLSFLPLNEEIEQPDGFKVKLFDYQKKSIAKMLDIENNGEYEISYNYVFKFGEIDINFDPNNGLFTDKKCVLKLKTKGGILADDMGLGKTITSLSLVALNPSQYEEETKNELIYSKATLIVCPSHLSKQWETEIKKIFPKANIVKLLTKNNHVNLVYQEIKSADIIIVTQQFLMNFKYYPQINYRQCTPSNFVFGDRIESLKKVLDNWNLKDVDIMKLKQPCLEHFYFHRLIVDEGHEIFGSLIANASVARYMSNWLEQVNSEFKWFVSGTAFCNREGMNKSFSFINLDLKEKNTNEDFNNKTIISMEYINQQILSKIMIRHRKSDVENQIKIPGYEEEIMWVKLTELEKNLYNSKKNNYVSKLTLQQLCCHILVSDTTSRMFGNVEVDLDVMKDKLIEYHKSTIETSQAKLEKLDSTAPAYAMVKKNYQNRISESKYMLDILIKLQNKENIDLDQNCTICFEELDNPSLTPCGHIYCKECLETCLKYKKTCPMCKTDLTGKEIYLVDSKKEIVEEETNPLIKKYGSKLGKLISVVRKLVSNEDNRIIIFSQWDKMLNLIGKSLSENGVENSFVKGNVWARNSAISKFKIGNDNKVIMLSLSNSASGTNLTEATHILFVEPINSSFEEVRSVESQAIGRACRLGQKNKIKVLRILTKDTIEEEIYQKIYSENKDNVERVMVDDIEV